MEKRSHRRIRDLDVLTAFQGLVANEIGCARISMMAREQETLPAMGRIQMRETNYLQIITSGLHRTAGPYRSTWSSDVDRRPRDGAPSCVTTHRTSRPWTYSSFRHWLRRALHLHHCPAGPQRPRLDQRHNPSDRRMDCAPDHGGIPLE